MYNRNKIITLGKLLLKLETRSHDGSKRKLIMLLISYLLPGIFLPFLLYKQNPDPTGFEFSFLTYLFFSLALSFTIISEFDNLIVSKTEIDIFTAMPIDDELVVNAKLYGIFRYIFIISLPLLVPASFYYYNISGSISSALLYFISGYALCLFVIYILLFFYAAASRILKTSRLSLYTLSVQVILIFLLILGYQFVSYIFTGKPGSAISTQFDTMQKNGLINYFPHAWFAFIPAKIKTLYDFKIAVKLILPLFVTYLSYLTLKYYLIENYSLIREKFMYSRGFSVSKDTSAGFFIFSPLGRLINKIYLRGNAEESSFNLMKSLFKRDKTVRLNILPMIIIPAGLALFAFLTNQLPIPFSSNYFDTKPVFHISILLSVLVVLNTGILGLKVTNYTGVSWIYDAYPVFPKKHFINGIRKFYNVFLLVPVCIIIFIFFALKMPVIFALVHALYIFTAANLFNSIYHLFNKTLPFTKDNTIFNSVSRLSSILLPFLYGMVFIFLQYIVYKNISTAIISIGVILMLTFWINYFGFVRSKT